MQAWPTAMWPQPTPGATGRDDGCDTKMMLVVFLVTYMTLAHTYINGRAYRRKRYTFTQTYDKRERERKSEKRANESSSSWMLSTEYGIRCYTTM